MFAQFKKAQNLYGLTEVHFPSSCKFLFTLPLGNLEKKKKRGWVCPDDRVLDCQMGSLSLMPTKTSSGSHLSSQKSIGGNKKTRGLEGQAYPT